LKKYSQNTPSYSEETLASLLINKDSAVLEILYDKYSEALYGIIFRIIKEPRLTEEVLQTCFVKIWKNAEKYDKNKGRLFTWMLRIARNTAIDATRSRIYTQSQSVLNLKEYSPLIDSSITSPLYIDGIDLSDFTKQLGKIEQDILELIYYQGYTHKEAAEKLNLPLGTLKTKLRSSIKKLRKLMSPLGVCLSFLSNTISSFL